MGIFRVHFWKDCLSIYLEMIIWTSVCQNSRNSELSEKVMDLIARVKQRWGKRYNKIEHLSFPSPSFQSASFSLALPMIRLFLNPGFKLLLYFIVEISTNFIIERGRLPPQYVIPDLFSNVYVCSCVFISIIVT